jgi:two-component system chemotaxis sensor kinase CheA
MTDPDDEFRMRLLATFREEADEHLTEITQDLLAIEKAGPDAISEHVEKAYRKVHSLKGAARAVKLRGIESVCQNLETVFSAMKKGEFAPDEEAFDLFHEALKVTRALLMEGDPAMVSSREINQRIRMLTSDGKSVGWKETPAPRVGYPLPAPGTDNPLTAPPPVPEKADGYQPLADPRFSLSQERDTRFAHNHESSAGLAEGTLPSLTPWDTHTVRVASDKLDRLISGSDDLLTTRLFITHRMLELEEMFTRFGIWHWNNTLVSSDLHRLRELSFGKQRTEIPSDLVLPLQRIVEFLEYNREFVSSLRHDLGVHIHDAEIDRSALESSTQMISDLIHDAVLLPIGSVLVPFNGLVRDYSRTTGKQVDFLIEGGEIEMDRRILEALKDPFMHLIHNSVDHGIEYPDIRAIKQKPVRGVVRIRVVPLSGSKVNIEIR